MGNAQTRHENRKTSQNTGGAADAAATATTTTATAAATTTSRHVLSETVETATTSALVEAGAQQPQQQQQQQITFGCVGGSRKSLQRATTAATTTTANSSSSATAEIQAEQSAATSAPQQQQQQQQRSRQLSTWSLGSLSGGRLNWSFSAAAHNSFRHRNKATRKSLTSLQGSRRSKTQWHRPLTNAIFSSHFPESSRNDQFHIDHLIAQGAFGVVFKVSDKSNAGTVQTTKKAASSSSSSSPRCYALKVLKKSKVIEENSVQQIKAEADIQKLCGHHPFIVQQIDLWQNRHNLHILSEYVPNDELFSKIAHFSIDLVRLYVAEIALAIDFLHNAGIIYRDAKPENILLTQNYHIKLTDFGLSKWLKLGATTRTMCGTFKYMAPEILKGEPYGHAVDWWALGVIVCQMLTQKCPNIKRHLMQQRDSYADGLSNAPSIAHINGCLMDSEEEERFLPDAVQQLPHEAQDVLRRLLALEPQQRIRSVLALQRIALYQNYKLEVKHLLSLSPRDIIARDRIHIYEDNHLEQSSSELAAKAFRDF